MDNIARLILDVAMIFIAIYLIVFLVAKATSIIIIIRSYIGTKYEIDGKDGIKTIGIFMAIKLYFYQAFIEKVKK